MRTSATEKKQILVLESHVIKSRNEAAVPSHSPETAVRILHPDHESLVHTLNPSKFNKVNVGKRKEEEGGSGPSQ